MNSREPPVQLPTGLPALLRYHEFFNYPYYPVTQDNDSPCYSDTAGPTSTPTAKTSGTGTPSSPTPRTHLRLPRHRCSGGPHRHPGGQHVDERPRITDTRCTGAPLRHSARPGAAKHELHLVPTSTTTRIPVFHYFRSGQHVILHRVSGEPGLRTARVAILQC